MKRKKTNVVENCRRTAAEERLKLRASITDERQLELIEHRRGESKKECARLRARVESNRAKKVVVPCEEKTKTKSRKSPSTP